MKKGEQALVTVDAEYLCDYNNSKGNTANNKVLYYEVELVDFVKVSFSYSPMYCNLQILVSWKGKYVRIFPKHTIGQGISQFKTSTQGFVLSFNHFSQP